MGIFHHRKICISDHILKFSCNSLYMVLYHISQSISLYILHVRIDNHNSLYIHDMVLHIFEDILNENNLFHKAFYKVGNLCCICLNIHGYKCLLFHNFLYIHHEIIYQNITNNCLDKDDHIQDFNCI